MKIGDKFIEKKETDRILLSIGSSKNFILEESLHIRVKYFNSFYGLENNKAVAFEIPLKFNTDGVSSPRFIWGLISPISWSILIPAIIHDWIWRNLFIHAFVVDLDTGIIVNDLGIINLTYSDGNNIMLEKMKSFFSGGIKRTIIYWLLSIASKFRK